MATSQKTGMTKGRWRQRFFSGTSLYGFELVVAVIGLLVTIGVLIYGIYALSNYLVGIDSSSTRQFTGELSVWLMATMIVWLPLTLFFYVRSRAEVTVNPKRETTLFHKFVIGAYRFVLLMGVIGLLFSVVYLTIRLLIGIEDNASDIALRMIVPGLVSAFVAGGSMVAFNRSHVPAHSLFSLLLSGVSVVVIVAVLAVSIGSIRDDAKDSRTVNDLSAIQSQINEYYVNKQTVPDNLQQLSGLTKEVNARLGEYQYTYKSANHYELCADFLTDVSDNRGYAVPVSSDSSYTYYPNFYGHGKGRQCYNLSASYMDDGSTVSPKQVPASSGTDY